MTRFLALTLSLLMLLALAACGGGEAPSADGGRTLRVGMECAYAPYNWAQPDDANGAVPIADSNEFANGYDVMMAKRLCERLGWQLEVVRLDWDSLVPAVQTGTIDCAIAGQSITSDRMEMVDFTAPYYYASIIVLARKDGPFAGAASVADLAGATGTSQINTVWYDICLPQIPGANILPPQDTSSTMLAALYANACDIVVTDMPTGQAAVIAYPDFTLLDFAGTDGGFAVSDEEINIGVSVQKGNAEVLDGLNSVLSGMTAEDFETLMNEAIAVQPLAE